MGRILAIDYGGRRCGLAVTDPLNIIANPLDTVLTKDLDPYLAKYISENNVDKLVLGMPKQMNGDFSFSWPMIEQFAEAFRVKYPSIPVEFQDERYTSKMASRVIAQSGLPKMKRQEKGLIDRTSAVIILQSFMEKY